MRRKNKAQSIVEVVIGVLILIPVGLVLLDLAALIVANSVNDELVKRAARAAANLGTRDDAQQAVDSIKEDFTKTNQGFVKSVDALQIVNFDEKGTKGVTVHSDITVAVPVPVPFTPLGRDFKFQAEATEPIVGIDPSGPGAE